MARPVIKFKGNFKKQHKGVNTTFRLGDHWARRVRIGQKVTLQDVDTKEKRTATVCGRVHDPLHAIEDDLVAAEHDPKLRSHSALVEGLAKIYGRNVDFMTPVSVISYWLD